MSDEQPQYPVACASCGNTVNGKFCGQCGEKVLKNSDKSILHFFEEFIHILTHADSKLLRSLKYLFTKPGYLTRQYLDGRRKVFTTPLSLFFIANLLYFFISPTDALHSRYISQTKGQFYSASIVAKGERKMQEKKWTPVQMEEHYNETSSKISKMMLVLLIFLFSIPVAILFYSRDSYYHDHLVFATEFINFIIYVVLFTIPFLLVAVVLFSNYIFHTRFDLDLNSDLSLFFLLMVLWSYLYMAARRVYKRSFLLPKTLALAFCTILAVTAYRYILFHITIAFL